MDFLNHAEKKRIRPQARSDGPKVSIIMACYNCQQFLTESLDSILAQTMTHWELLCLDDASTDGTSSIIAEYSAKDTRVKPFYFDTNEGPYVRRNFAIARANSDFIMIHDADDIMVSNKVQRLYDQITSDTTSAIVGSGYLNFIDEFRGPEYTQKYEFPTEHTDILNGLLSGQHTLCHASCIIRKKLFDAVGLYDENPWGADAFWLAKVGEYIRLTGRFKLKNIPEFLMLRRLHLHSQSCRIGLVDPRSERKLYKRYYRQKLKDAVRNLESASTTDVSIALKNCVCSDFLRRFRDDIEKSKAQPADFRVIVNLLTAAVKKFLNRRYVSCVRAINNAETMCTDLVKTFKNCDLLRAMCYVALDMKPGSRKYLNREIQNHDSPAAKQFFMDYLEKQLTTDVQKWHLENAKHYDLRVTVSDTCEQHSTTESSDWLNELSRKLAERDWMPGRARKDSPKVSIIMSCYNCEQFLTESLDSILAQTMTQWELFVLDDASTDGTRSIIAEFSAKDSRIKPFYFDTNEGPYVRRNFAITRANSDFIMIHDADDIMVPNKVQRLYSEITSDGRLGIVGAFWRNFIDNFKGLEYTEKREFPTEHNDIVMGRDHAISHASGIIRKELFDLVGLYDENRCACDSFWLAKVAEYAHLTGTLKLKNIPEFLMLRRIHSASQTRKMLYCDPRSRRRLYQQHYLNKLKEMTERLKGASLADIRSEFKNCTCSGFAEKHRDQIAKLESQPIDNRILIELLQSAIKLFCEGKYVSSITKMDGIETMCNDFVKVFKNCDLLRAMCCFGLDMKPESLRYLNSEIKNHNNPAARQFLRDYFEKQSTTSVQQWYSENGKRYDLRITVSSCLNQDDLGNRSGQLNRLRQQLVERNWQGRFSSYQEFFEYVTYQLHVAAPTISVIVISWRLHPDTIKSFESLIQQRNEIFELVFVDNGARPGEFDTLKPFIDTYVRLNQNTGAYFARNIGAVFARGRLLLFLDDDGVPAPDILRSYRQAFDECQAIAVRGSIWPKDRNAPPYTEHLYYGDRPFPYFSCQEGNTAYRALFFYVAGGWDDEIILGGAGLDLSRRLLDVEPDMRKQIYWPKAVLYHDRNDQRADWERKKQIREASVERLKHKHPDYGIFQQCYKKYLQREDLLIHKDKQRLSEPDVKEVFEHSYQNQEPVRAPQPMRKDSTHTSRVLALNDKAKNLQANGDIRGAMCCFTDAFRLDPTDFNTVSNICRLYKQMGWTQEAESLMRKCSQNNLDDPGSSKQVELLSVKPHVGRNGDLKFSFIMIVLNGMPFVEYSLKSVYDFAHEIIIAEGAVEDCMFAANPDGSSKDGTVEFIRSFPDPANKIKLIQGKWPEKCEMQNEALKYVTGDYAWLIDSDEVYKKEDLEKTKELLRKDPSITQVNFIPDNFWKGLDYIFVSPMFFEHPHHFRRLFKYVQGAYFTTHRPPTMVWPNSSLTTEQMHLVDGLQTRRMGIILYHYSYVVHEQVSQKMEYYGRRGPWEISGLNRSQWYHQCYLKWTPANRKEIEANYPVWMGDKNSYTEPFKGSHPQVMADFIAHSKTPDPQAGQPHSSALAKKNALVSYITAPLRMGPNYHPHKFSNPGIARSMVKVLTRMGYVVDVIDFNCKDFKSDKVYDLFIGHAGVNWEYLSRNVLRDAVKIYFSTSLYWRQFNRREAARFESLQKRRGVRLPYDRWIKVSEEFAVHDADGIVCLGNRFAAQSYAGFPLCICVNNGVYRDDHYDRTDKDFDSARRHFLYFGSAGNIHKGLDLLVEAFMQLDADLWYAGKVESAFYKVYADELPSHPNIHFINENKWVNLRSPLFYELMNRCNCVILPSCAEGSCGGVVECMNQGLIPIVSRGATIDVADFGIMLRTDSVEEIVRVVREVMAKSTQWHRRHSIMTRQAVLRDFSEQAFCTNLRTAIENVLTQAPKIRIAHKKAASQAMDNPAAYLNTYANDLGALLRGAVYLKAYNRHDEAARLWRRAVVVDSSCITAMSELAAYYADKGQMKEASGFVKRALELCPTDERCLRISEQIVHSTHPSEAVSPRMVTSPAVKCSTGYLTCK